MKVDTTTLWVLAITTTVWSATSAQGLCADGEVRLQGGPNEFEGRVEICEGTQWVSLCSDSGWYTPEARIVCKQLGFDSSQNPIIDASSSLYGMGEESIFIASLRCPSESAPNVSVCEYNTSDSCSDTAGVLCADPMCDASMDGLTRLVNQTTANGGRVETCVNGGFWRPVCEGNWNEVNAKVVCRQLGLSDEEVTAVTDDRFGSVRYRNSAYQNVSCFGNETRLVDCPRDNSGQSPLCSFSGVVCGAREVSSAPPPTAIVSVIPTDDTTSTSVSSTKDPETVVLLAALLGAFGGVILLLLCVIVVIFGVVRGKNRKRVIQSRKSTPCSELHSVTYLDSPTNGVSKVTIDNAVYANSTKIKREDSEPERVLLNPLYSLTKKSQSVKAENQPYYSEITVSTSEPQGQKPPATNVYYSVIPPNSQYANLESPEGDESTETLKTVSPKMMPVTDQVYYSMVPPERQYATLESPLTEENPGTVAIKPYEVPMIQPYVSSPIMKGTLASSNDSLDVLIDESSNIHATSVPKPHILQSSVAHQEYATQQESALVPNPHRYHDYDSPKMASKSPHRSDSVSQGQKDTNVMMVHVYDTPRMSRASKKTQSAEDDTDRDYDEPA